MLSLYNTERLFLVFSPVMAGPETFCSLQRNSTRILCFLVLVYIYIYFLLNWEIAFLSQNFPVMAGPETFHFPQRNTAKEQCSDWSWHTYIWPCNERIFFFTFSFRDRPRDVSFPAAQFRERIFRDCYGGDSDSCLLDYGCLIDGFQFGPTDTHYCIL